MEKCHDFYNLQCLQAVHRSGSQSFSLRDHFSIIVEADDLWPDDTFHYVQFILAEQNDSQTVQIIQIVTNSVFYSPCHCSASSLVVLLYLADVGWGCWAGSKIYNNFINKKSFLRRNKRNAEIYRPTAYIFFKGFLHPSRLWRLSRSSFLEKG